MIFVLLAVALIGAATGGVAGGLVAFAFPGMLLVELDIELGLGRPAHAGSREVVPASQPYEPLLGVPSNAYTRAASLGAAAGLVLGLFLGFFVALIDQVLLFSRNMMAAVTLNAPRRPASTSYTPPPSVEI